MNGDYLNLVRFWVMFFSPIVLLWVGFFMYHELLNILKGLLIVEDKRKTVVTLTQCLLPKNVDEKFLGHFNSTEMFI